MRHGVFITGTDVGVGKTLIGCALAFAAHSRGLRVGVMKPIETGCREVAGVGESAVLESLESKDARGLAYASACDLPLELICPYRYRSPLAPPAAAAADQVEPPDLVEIAEAYRKIAARSDFVIVEGIGGIATPIAWSKDSTDLARALNLDIVIVAANRDGCLNASMLTIHHARSRGLAIAGLILNDVDATIAPSAETNLESLRKSSDKSLRVMSEVPILERVRHKQPVTREIIDALLS
jgi:dethiobiotin synthetase